ncbi:MAG: division/cell wall cluster transcriptional repressor MraZ [Opitutales bacterium]
MLTSAIGFSGEHFHSLDEKKRLTVPARWRQAVFGPSGRPGKGTKGEAAAPGLEANGGAAVAEEECFLAMPNPNGSITVHPPSAVVRLKEKLANVSMGDSRSLRVMQAIFGKSEFLRFDTQGRFTLPEVLLKHAGLEKESVLVGMVANFHIWNPERHRAYVGEADLSPEELGAVLRELNL